MNGKIIATPEQYKPTNACLIKMMQFGLHSGIFAGLSLNILRRIALDESGADGSQTIIFK